MKRIWLPISLLLNANIFNDTYAVYVYICTYIRTYVYTCIYIGLYLHRIVIYIHDKYAFDFADTYVIKQCNVTSPSYGTVRISCDVPREVLATLTCNIYDDNCNNPKVRAIGNGPFIVRGLDPGVMYYVTITFDTFYYRDEVGLTDQTVTATITVNSDGELFILFIIVQVIT